MTRRSTPAAGRHRSCGTGDRRDGACGRQRSWDGRDSTSGPNHPSVGRAVRTKRRRGAPIFQPRAGGKGKVRDLAGRVSPAAGRGDARGRDARRGTHPSVSGAPPRPMVHSRGTQAYTRDLAPRDTRPSGRVFWRRVALPPGVYSTVTPSSCGAARGLLIARANESRPQEFDWSDGTVYDWRKFCMGGNGRFFDRHPL